MNAGTERRDSIDSLRRVFHEGFLVRDIAEPLVSFDETTAAADVLKHMRAAKLEVVGVRRQGLVNRFIDSRAAADGPCGKHSQPFDEAAVLDYGASLATVVVGLDRSPRLFVRSLGAIHGVVTRRELQKAPVRMWLFGMITLLEMRMSELVEQLVPQEAWQQFLSQGRLQKSEELLRERRRRGQGVRLVDCLQFADKGQIVGRCDQLRAQTRFTSRRQTEDAVKALQNLRNNLAHAQDIVADDWGAILLLASELDQILVGPNRQDSPG